MEIKELQERFNNIIKLIKDNNCYLDKNNKVCENKDVYVINIEGIFYDEYMGDSDWKYRNVSGDIIIPNDQARQLINNITSENEEQIGNASKLFGEILTEYDDDFEKLYSVEYGEFNNVSKGNNSIRFDEKSEDDWNFEITIQKKPLNLVKDFDISNEKFGCI